ncbi:hypothetical protein JW979_15705 [bacterium]|nr:hypothetical protein [candidate division CSSED10-310 bacterium]
MTVILPSAGEGTRLGLNTPKELFEIDSGIALIDFSLAHIKQFVLFREFRKLIRNIHIAVVVKPGKCAVFERVKVLFPDIETHAVMFDNRFFEWPGSVYSAKELFSDVNIVLLPDSFLSLSDSNPFVDPEGKTLIQKMLECLTCHSVAFGAVESQKENELRYLGAVCVSKDNIVTAFQDKPQADFHKYNGYWGCYGFKKSAAWQLYRFLLDSVNHESTDILMSAFAPATAFLLHQYIDLGNWERVENFRKSGIIPKLRHIIFPDNPIVSCRPSIESASSSVQDLPK